MRDMKKCLGLLLFSFAALSSATFVDDFRNGVGFSIRSMPSDYTISGFLNDLGTTADGTWNAVTKPAGSLSGTVGLAALFPEFGFTGTGNMVGTATSNETIRFAISAPSVIGQTVPVNFNGVTVNVKITSFTGELNAILSKEPAGPDPANGACRTLRFDPDINLKNEMVVKGTVNTFIPVTLTIPEARYEGLGGGDGNPPTKCVVKFQTFAPGKMEDRSFSVFIRKAGTNEVLDGFSTTSDSAAASVCYFCGTSPVDIEFGTVGGLTTIWKNVTPAALQTQLITMALGDADGDNYVGSDDYLALNAAFDTNAGDDDFNDQVDFNLDGYIGSDDYLVLNHYFDTTGPLIQ